MKGLTPDQYPKKLLAKGKKRPLEATKEPALANQTPVQEIKVEGEAGLPPGLEALLDTTRMASCSALSNLLSPVTDRNEPQPRNRVA